jgi:hypothetical protein
LEPGINQKIANLSENPPGEKHKTKLKRFLYFSFYFSGEAPAV